MRFKWLMYVPLIVLAVTFELFALGVFIAWCFFGADISTDLVNRATSAACAGLICFLFALLVYGFVEDIL